MPLRLHSRDVLAALLVLLGAIVLVLKVVPTFGTLAAEVITPSLTGFLTGFALLFALDLALSPRPAPRRRR